MSNLDKLILHEIEEKICKLKAEEVALTQLEADLHSLIQDNIVLNKIRNDVKYLTDFPSLQSKSSSTPEVTAMTATVTTEANESLRSHGSAHLELELETSLNDDIDNINDSFSYLVDEKAKDILAKPIFTIPTGYVHRGSPGRGTLHRRGGRRRDRRGGFYCEGPCGHHVECPGEPIRVSSTTVMRLPPV